MDRDKIVALEAEIDELLAEDGEPCEANKAVEVAENFAAKAMEGTAYPVETRIQVSTTDHPGE